ncbi:MAG TPA: T9SS type A sorting domain-containing protein, partial [Candidatus Kapabacteria bacterium]
NGNGIGTDIFAWIPSDTAIRAVIHYHPIFADNHVAEYYTPFMVRVLCDYFGLCEDVVKEVSAVPSAISLRVESEGMGTMLLSSTEEAGSLEVMNALGVLVFRESISIGTNRISIPESLSNGVYFARLASGNVVQSRMFVVTQK